MEQMQMGGFEEEKVFLGNQMQKMLAERHGEQMEDFIDKHAAAFREYVNGSDTILHTFKTNPEEALKEIEPTLYH